MTKKIVKRTDANNETLYFYTHSDAVDVGEGSSTKSLTEVIDDTLHKSAQTLTNAEKTQVYTNLGLNGVDDVPTENSNNIVRSGGVKAAIDDVIDDFTNRGFMYKGIAPASAPLGEDKTFYIAKSGDYTAYTGIGDGSFTLNGIAVLTYATATTSGAWTKNDIVLFDEEPTANSNNLVKSGGVSNRFLLTELKIESSDATLNINRVGGNFDIVDGMTVAANSRLYFTLTAKNNDLNPAPNIKVLDNNDNVLETLSCIAVPDNPKQRTATYTNNSDTNLTVKLKYINNSTNPNFGLVVISIIPTKSITTRIDAIEGDIADLNTAIDNEQTRAEGAEGLLQQSLSSNVSRIDSKIEDIEDVIYGEQLSFVEDITNQRTVGKKIITNTYQVGDIVDTTPTSQSNVDCMLVEVVEGELFIITGKGVSSSAFYAWLDNDKKLISLSSPSGTSDTNKLIEAPSDGYLILNSINNNASYPISYKRVLNTIGNADKYRNINGGIGSLNKWFYTVPIKVNSGDTINYPYETGASVAPVTEVTSSGEYISIIPFSESIHIHKGCYISLSIYAGRIDNLVLIKNGIVDNNKTLSEDIQQLDTSVSELADTVNHSIVVTSGQNLLGTLISDATIINGLEEEYEGRHATDYIPVKQGVKYYYKNVYRGNYAFYGEGKENEIISYANVVSIDSPNRLPLPFIPPIGAKYVRLTILNTTDPSTSWLNTKDESPSGVPSTELSEEIINDSKIVAVEHTGLVNIDNNPLAKLVRGASYAGIIHSWGIVGDSLASGEMQCYDNTSESSSDYRFIDMYQWGWGQIFAKMNNVECYNFSNGGQTTWGWLKNQGVVHDNTYIGGVGGGDWRLAQQAEYLKDGYIIALGVNDRAKIANNDYELGEVSDIQEYTGNNDDIDDTSVNPKSFVRYYAGIIQRIKSVRPKAKIFCVTTMGSDYSEIAQKIREIVEFYSASGVYLIDLETYSPIKDRWNPSFMYNMNGHGSSIGYEYTAYEINTYIDWIIRNNGNDFKGTALIGLENYREKYSE